MSVGGGRQLEHAANSWEIYKAPPDATLRTLEAGSLDLSASSHPAPATRLDFAPHVPHQNPSQRHNQFPTRTISKFWSNFGLKLTIP
jgi:hypothetical protein